MAAGDNKGIVRRVIEESWSNGNMSVVDELVSSDFVDHDPPPNSDLHGPEGVKHVAQMFRSGFPDLKVNIEQLLEEGDKVAVRYTFTGTNTGNLLDIQPTNNRLNVASTDIYRVSNGKIAERWGGFDTLGLLEQLGIVKLGYNQGS